MSAYKKLKPFEIWCHDNFPYIEETFQELNYYELLCKIVEYLNTTINNVDGIHDDVEEYKELFQQLHDYVDNYFDNLDVQEEINNKLDSMSLDGTLTNLIKNYVDPIYEAYETRIDGEVDELEQSINTFESTVNTTLEIFREDMSNIASGSPAGVYATLAALQSADPDHSKIYLVEADGEWYFWNTATSQWKNGGVYQATQIANKSITPIKTDFIEKYNKFNYNSDTEVLTMFYASTEHKIVTDTNKYSVILPCKNNTQYTVEKTVTDIFAVILTETYPVSQLSYNNAYQENSTNQISFTTGADDNYMVVSFKSVNEIKTNAEILSTLKVFETNDLFNRSKLFIKDLNIESLNLDSLPFIKRVNLFDKNNYILVEFIKNVSANEFTLSHNVKSTVIPCKPNTKYCVTKTSSNRFTAYTSVGFPWKQVPITNVQTSSTPDVENDKQYLFITSGSNDKYLTVYFATTGEAKTTEEIINSLVIYEGETYDSRYIDYDDVKIKTNYLDLVSNTEITKLSDNMINLLSNRPLGPLEKGYIALSCDDGNTVLATYTIPKLKEYKTLYNKNIPVTFGLMTDSPVLQYAAYKALVQEMLNDYGCSVAIHGSTSYNQYTTEELKQFLDEQKSQLTILCGVAPTSIIFPEHAYNTKIAILAGSYYGVCCTGGNKNPINYGIGKSAGPRSNMYTLYRFSLLNVATTKAKIKEAIDDAYDNHLIFMPFWHDMSLNTDEHKELLDYCVEYANEKGLEFINVGDIPNIK